MNFDVTLENFEPKSIEASLKLLLGVQMVSQSITEAFKFYNLNLSECGNAVFEK